MKKLLSIISCMALCLFAVQSCEDPEPAKPEVVPVQGVTVSVSSSEMGVDDVGKLTVTVSPSNATDKLVSYKSSDPYTVEVDTQGNIYAHKPGTVTITVTTRDGGKVATVTITVKENGQSTVAVTGVTLDETLLELTVGQSKSLTATVQPSNASNKSVSWRSSDSSIATVDPNGKVTAVKAGTANITVITVDQEKTATCKVNVSATAVAVTGISLNKASLELEQGSSETLIVRIKPDNATNKNVTWKSSNTSVATVDSNGKVTAVNAGTANITVTSEDGNKTATCKVTVTSVGVPVSGVNFYDYGDSEIALYEGEDGSLKIIVHPSNATDKTVSCTSSAPDVLKTEEIKYPENADYCVVHIIALKEGKATVTVTTTDGGYSDNIEVTVKKYVPVESITFEQASVTVEQGNFVYVKYYISPSDASYKNLDWSSSNNDVARATGAIPASDAPGVFALKVVGAGVGTATITAKSRGQGSEIKTASFKVTVVPSSVAVTGVTLNKTSLSLEEGASETLTATVQPSDATNKKVSWKSSNTSVATVDSNGKVTAKSAGSATITVTTEDGKKTATCSVTVKAAIVNVPVTGVSLNYPLILDVLGESHQLIATVSPDNATNKNVTWKSSDTNVATVSSTGLVTLKGQGTATITVTTVDGGYTATCRVEAMVAATGVSLDKTSLSLKEGDQYTLKATVQPSNTNFQGVSWKSSNNSVATVDSNGKVTAVGVGAATITVTTDYGSFRAICNVTVSAGTVAVTGVTLNAHDIGVGIGTVIKTIYETVSPSNATNKNVTWSSDDSSIVSVQTISGEATPTITAKKVGTTYIRVRTVDGGFTDACKIQVFPNPVTGVTLSKSVLEMNVGAAVSVSYTVQPSNATDKSITATSDNTSIATVRVVGSSTLEITGVGAGSTYVRVKTVDGGYTASCKVTVIDPSIHVTSVSLDASAIGMWDTQSYQLHATVSPSNATNKNVTWSSSNTSIVTVSSSGLVRGVTGASGTAYVTVKTVDGGKTAQCRFSITRQIRVTGVSLNCNAATIVYVGGSALSVTPVFTPSNASVKTGKWTNSNPDAVSIQLDGENSVIIRGLKAGQYSQVTFTSDDGGFRASTTVNVR